jgi:hypothetical protein
MYDDLLDDPKVQRLPPLLFKAWVNILCLASKHGGRIPSIEDSAFALRTDESSLSDIFSNLVARGLIDAVGDHMEPHNWPARQFKSDKDETAAQRQRFKRERDKAIPTGNVTQDVTRDTSVTSRPPETETETETEEDILGPSAPQIVETKLPKSEPEGFIAFWEAYPKRDGSPDRKGAVKAFGPALRRASLEIILDGARHFADAMTARGKTGTEFIPQARTWLNGDRWNERYESSTPLDDKQAKARAVLEKYAYAPPESRS